MSMRIRLRSSLSCTLACAVVAITGCATPDETPARPPALGSRIAASTVASGRTFPGSAVASTSGAAQVIIDSNLGEVFVPVENPSLALMTADEAFAAQAQRLNSDRLTPPEGDTIQLGRLTMPIGPGQGYTARDQLVWAFRTHQCPASRALNPSAAPNGPCIEWMFLNADTGALIDDTYQQ